MGPEFLAREAEFFRTRVGACWPGTRAVFRGQDLHRDLAGISWMDLFLFGITGRRFAPNELRVLEQLWVLTSYPDGRLWNNRVAAFASSARSSPVLGLSAGLAATEATVFSGGPGLVAIDFFHRAGEQLARGVAPEAIVAEELQRGHILGYGRPINSVDERLPMLMRLLEEEDLDRGLHYRFSIEVERLLLQRNPKLRLNYAGATAAVAADLGFTSRQYQLYNIFKTMGGMPPCIVEAAGRPEGSLMPISCAQVAYEGPSSRKWRP
jgi:citrate synthase